MTGKAILLAGLALTMFGQTTLQPGGNPSRNRGMVPSLLFVVHYRSIEPKQVTVPEGAYDIQLRSGVIVSEIEYELSETGNSLKRSSIAEKGKGRHLLPVELKAGTYVLSIKGAASRWSSTIVVTKK